MIPHLEISIKNHPQKLLPVCWQPHTRINNRCIKFDAITPTFFLKLKALNLLFLKLVKKLNRIYGSYPQISPFEFIINFSA